MLRKAQVNPTRNGAIARITLGNAYVETTYNDEGQILANTIAPVSAADPTPPRTGATAAAPPAEAQAAASERGQGAAPGAIPGGATPAGLRLMADRLQICQACPDYQRATALTVACARCGCQGLSLLSGDCPRSLWPPAPGTPAPGITLTPAPGFPPSPPSELAPEQNPH
jgi:hypothetical protein